MVGKTSERRAMDSQLLVRLTPQLLHRVTVLAAGSGMSAAAWARGAIVTAVGDIPNPSEEIRASPPASARVLPADDVVALSKAIATFGKGVGAAVQLAAALREAGDKPRHEQTETVLADLRRTAARARFILERVLKTAERAS